MRIVTAHKHGVQHAGQHDVRDIFAMAGDEAEILFTL